MKRIFLILSLFCTSFIIAQNYSSKKIYQDGKLIGIEKRDKVGNLLLTKGITSIPKKGYSGDLQRFYNEKGQLIYEWNLLNNEIIEYTYDSTKLVKKIKHGDFNFFQSNLTIPLLNFISFFPSVNYRDSVIFQKIEEVELLSLKDLQKELDKRSSGTIWELDYNNGGNGREYEYRLSTDISFDHNFRYNGVLKKDLYAISTHNSNGEVDTTFYILNNNVEEPYSMKIFRYDDNGNKTLEHTIPKYFENDSIMNIDLVTNHMIKYKYDEQNNVIEESILDKEKRIIKENHNKYRKGKLVYQKHIYQNGKWYVNKFKSRKIRNKEKLVRKTILFDGEKTESYTCTFVWRYKYNMDKNVNSIKEIIKYNHKKYASHDYELMYEI